jgi:hypothetical protein
MDKVSKYDVISAMAATARTAPDQLRFVAQLLDVAPCLSCDFIQYHCICPGKSPLIGHNED